MTGAGLREGDPGAWREVVARYESLIYGIALSHHVCDPDDVVQEAWARLAAHVDEVENPKAWLAVTARNLCIDQLRKEKRSAVADDAQPSPDHADRVAATTDAQVEASRLWDALRVLTPQQRRAVSAYAEHQNYKKAAAAIGVSRGTLKIHLHRARQKLRPGAGPMQSWGRGRPKPPGERALEALAELPEVVTPSQVAALARVKIGTVGSWARQGRLTEAGRHGIARRYRRDDVEALIRSRMAAAHG